MAAPSVAQALRVPGTLSVGPFTDITAAADSNGGTRLGLIRDVVLRRIDLSSRAITAPEYGGENLDLVRGGADWVLALAIRGMDADGLAASGLKTFASGGNTGLRDPDATLGHGQLAGDLAKALLFTPNDRANHPGVIFYAAFPRVARELVVPFGSKPEVLWRIAFVARRDSQGRRVEVQTVGGMTAP